MSQEISESGIEKATKIKPKAFYSKKDVSLLKLVIMMIILKN